LIGVKERIGFRPDEVFFLFKEGRAMKLVADSGAGLVSRIQMLRRKLGDMPDNAMSTAMVVASKLQVVSREAVVEDFIGALCQRIREVVPFAQRKYQSAAHYRRAAVPAFPRWPQRAEYPYPFFAENRSTLSSIRAWMGAKLTDPCESETDQLCGPPRWQFVRVVPSHWDISWLTLLAGQGSRERVLHLHEGLLFAYIYPDLLAESDMYVSDIRDESIAWCLSFQPERDGTLKLVVSLVSSGTARNEIVIPLALVE